MGACPEIGHAAVSASHLGRVEFFDEFSPADRRQILGFSRVRQLAAGEQLFVEGSPCQALHLLLSGQVKMNKISSEGKEQVIRHLSAGQIFGAAPLFDPKGIYPASAVALEPSCVLSVPKSRFVSMLMAKPDLFLKVLAFMSVHIQEMMRLVESVSLDKVPRRLAQQLLKVAKAQGGPKTGQVLQLGQSQTALAAELGTVREVVSRALRQLREDGVILLDGQRITLLEPTALEKI